MDRRKLLMGGIASPFASIGRAWAGDDGAIPIGDMHTHLFFLGPNAAPIRPLGRSMALGQATLVAWSLVGDMPWIQASATGLRQKGAPGPGAATAWFWQEVGRIKQHIVEQKLKTVAVPEDIDRALDGDPHVVLAIEGASFLDDGIDGLQAVHQAGFRHIQLVHFIRNAIGDFQTERPHHEGLSEYGRKVVKECNRLGILVDLAHCSSATVQQALAVSGAPMVWSHGSVVEAGSQKRSAPWQVRQLDLDKARAIAAKGGVVGLWGLSSDVGTTIEAYAHRLEQMAHWLGDEHVAFGSDMNALRNPAIASFADLRRVVTYLEKRGWNRSRARNIAIGNYARVLRRAMQPGPA